jgi:chromosome segregation ATPase
MNYEILGLVLAALFMILGGLASLYKATTSMRKERQEENENILELSKQYTDNKILSLEKELKYHKEIHESKVAELSEKIEQLREEMRRHHSQLVDLLTKMIEKS